MRGAAVSIRRTRLALPHYIPAVVIGVLVIAFGLGFRVALNPSPYRQTVAIIGDPVMVLSLDAKRKKASVLTLTSDVVIRGALGYGKFSLQSLASLDNLDKREGVLLAHSLSRALGLPVTMVVRGGEHRIEEPLTPDVLRRFITLRSKPATVGWAPWIAFVRAVSSLPVDGLRVLDVSTIITPTVLPDGSQQKELDETRIDAYMGSEFFDTDIREESLSVAIYNTTDTAAVGKVFARQLTHIGVRLVMVGNKVPAIASCRIVARKEKLTTYTAKFLQRSYGCAMIIDEQAGSDIGADLIFELGEQEASYYSS